MSRFMMRRARNLTPQTRSSGRVVAFVGIDGAGKSTIVNGVCEELRLRGIVAESAWCGFSDWVFLGWPVRILRNLAGKHREDSKSTAQHPNDEKAKRILENSFVMMIYYFAVSLEYMLQVSVKVALPRVNGRIIICDRYYIDQSISNSVELHAPRMERLFLEYFSMLLPRPDKVFVVLVPPEIAFSRKNDIPTLGYVSSRYKRYQHLATRNGYMVLDGRNDPQVSITRSLQEILPIVTR